MIDIQFSKKIVIFSVFIVCAVLAGNFFLSWFGKETLSDVAVAVITMYGGFTTGGYFALTGCRDVSVNKYNRWVEEENK